MKHLFALAVIMFAAQTVEARGYDVSLTQLSEADEVYYEGIAREMGLVFAPLHLGPGRTTGHSGFEYTFRYSSHNIHQNRSHWTRVMDLGGAVNVPDTLSTTTIEVRKGLPFGLELGTNLTWLENSQTIALGGRLRLGLLEGYQASYAPDVAVHAGVNPMLGSTDLDLTTVAAGATVSYRKSAFGRLTITPFLGFDFLLVQAGSHLLINPDFDPNQEQEDVNRLIVFQSLALDDPDNQWSRVRYGLRVESLLMAFTVQHDLPVDDRERPDQHAISVGLSAHF